MWHLLCPGCPVDAGQRASTGPRVWQGRQATASAHGPGPPPGRPWRPSSPLPEPLPARDTVPSIRGPLSSPGHWCRLRLWRGGNAFLCATQKLCVGGSPILCGGPQHPQTPDKQVLAPLCARPSKALWAQRGQNKSLCLAQRCPLRCPAAGPGAAAARARPHGQRLWLLSVSLCRPLSQ